MSKPTDLVQGTLDLLILKTLALEPMQGSVFTTKSAGSNVASNPDFLAQPSHVRLFIEAVWPLPHR